MTDTFSVGVRDSDGRWPAPPSVWSYTSLREATECPRRWMLSRASYPKLWDRPGYPRLPTLAALAGDVVHAVLERLAAAFGSAGCQSLADPSTVAVLKELGGYTNLVEEAINHRMKALSANPRAAGRVQYLHSALRTKLPELRQRVQSVVARMPVAVPSETLLLAPGTGGGGLTPGSYPELDIYAPALHLAGRVDLLVIDGDGCQITDYKTGSPDDHHRDQLRIPEVFVHPFRPNPYIHSGRFRTPRRRPLRVRA